MKTGQLYLTGFMGTGKSTVARCLCRYYNMKQIEMDRQIEVEEGMKISQIFKEKGEAYFRKKETEFLEKIQDQENVVVSCGGGTVMQPRNVEIMKKNGKIVLLTAQPETILRRVKNNHDRPLLEGKKSVEAIIELKEARRPKYEAAADYQIATDGKSDRQICEEIINEWNIGNHN